MPHALVVDDDSRALRALADLVESEGFSTHTAGTLERARNLLQEEAVDLVLCDLVLPDGKGTKLLEDIQPGDPTEVILVTGHESVETAVEALRLGAYDYLTKPVDIPRLKTLLAQVSRTRELKEEVSSLRGELRELGRFGALVGTSPQIQRAYDLAEKVAATEASVFLVGESGTGKELFAQTIHRLSPRKKKPFLPLNCGAVSRTLIESELFGHERGSFTGASRQHKGYFERANGGILFLDEIAEMPLELQVKLLRVLETGSLFRVGGTQPVEVDTRIISATNRDPDEAQEEGLLREDLYYRLKVFPIHIPPLRDRQGDVQLLAEHFLQELNRHSEIQKRYSPETLELIERHHWPGNVRELKNVVQRAFILADEVISPENLPAEVGGDEIPSGPSLHVKVGASIAEVEKRLILATLHHMDGNKKEAASTLGVSLKTLYNRLNSYKEEEEEEARRREAAEREEQPAEAPAG